MHEGSALPSSATGPVVFYVSSALPDGGFLDRQLSVVDGGTVTFTTDRRLAVGTLSNLVLSRMGQTLVTVASGSFQATNP